MNISHRKVSQVILMYSLVLVSCTPSRIEAGSTPPEAASDTPSPTLQPYWGLDPSLPDPVGGWLTFRAEEVDLTLEYPSVYEYGYEDGGCGDKFMVKKESGDNKYHLIGFGSSIRISVVEEWGSEIDELIKTGQPPSDLTLLTDVETFSIGGEPAFRYIQLIIQDPEAFEYAKTAWTFFKDKLYMFRYVDIADLARCGAPPLSEEAVYEYLISTVEFLE